MSVTARCIAPIVVDGYTRVAVDFAPWIGAWAELERFTRLREPRTEAEERRDREHGGRIEHMPMPDGSEVAMVVRTSGSRHQVLTFYAEDEVYVRVGLESGEVQIQFKARALWAWGYQRLAMRWLDAVTSWCIGERCGLDKASDARSAAEIGWRTTGIELCSDFIGLDFSDVDSWAFVGFRRRSLFQREGDEHPTETANWGTRSCPISLCIYDKDEQIKAAKDGDDSVYAAAHRANGWDGKAPRVRVEFRLNGRALILENDETGERIDMRDPATLADRGKLLKLWAILAASKRLVLRETATRKKRCALDPRWREVMNVGDTEFLLGFRQTRETQCDTHTEALKRARRAAIRALAAVAALHGVDAPNGEATLVDLARFVIETQTDEEHEAFDGYAAGYMQRREAFIGNEIRTRGRPRWEAWRMATAPPDEESDT